MIFTPTLSYNSLIKSVGKRVTSHDIFKPVDFLTDRTQKCIRLFGVVTKLILGLTIGGP